MKKFFALVLFCGFFSIVFADVSDETSSNRLDPAETGYDFIVDGIYYKILDTDKVSTSEGENPYSGKIVIPDEVTFDGITYRVTKVSGFRKSPDVTEITIPKYTETISAFYGAYSYWQGAPGIKSPGYRTTDTSAKSDSVAEQSKLTRIFFNAIDCRNAYYSYHATTMLGGGYDGEQSVFPSSVTDIVFGEEVTRVPNGLLMYCPEITKVVFPESVQYIGWKIISEELDKVSECKLLCSDLQEIAWLPFDRSVVSLGPEFHTYPCGMEYGVYNDIPTGIIYDTSKHSTMFHDFLGLDFTAGQPMELPSWVEKIAPNAFQGCKGGLKLKLPQSITEISAGSFKDCKQLEEITIPASVKRVESDAFKGCSNLKVLYFNAESCADPDLEFDYPFKGCSSLSNVVLGDGCRRIPSYFFRDCAGLKSVVIPESLVEIGKYAFRGTGLKEISIPKNVVTLGEFAFRECEDLTALYYDAGNCSEAVRLFENCPLLTDVHFGESVSKVPDWFLYECSGLKQVVLPNTITEIGEYAFYLSGLTEVTIPEAVIRIGKSAFQGCKDLKTVNFNAVNCEAENLFSYTSLENLVFGESVEKIASGFANGCNSLVDIIIPESVIEIGEAALSWTGLTEVTIPRAVKHIGQSAFSCEGLKTVNFNAVNCDADSPFSFSPLKHLLFGESVEKISSNIALYCDSLVEITIPVNVREIGASAFGRCVNLTTMNFNAVNCKVVPTDDGWYGVFNDAKFKMVSFGKRVKKIPNHILYKHWEITQVEIPDSVIEIGDYAFAYTWITDVTIPDCVTRIGEGAFYECPGLASIVIGSSVEDIGDMAFYEFGGNAIKTVSSLNSIPPKMPKDAFFVNAYWNATLSVPTGALDAYQTADSWKEFRKFAGVDFTGIEDVKIKALTPSIYYNLQGVETVNPKKGVYIKRQGNKASKVVIK